MLKKLLVLLFTCSCVAGGAWAEQQPVALQSDDRIKHFVYDENNVYRLDLFLKSVTAVQFDDGEVVESIIIGDSASWEIVKLNAGNVISIKPTIDAALTNMTVYTDRRVYTFELNSAGDIEAGAQAKNQSFRTVFSYPEDKTRDDSLAVGGPVDPGYLVSGFAPFRPIAVQDDTLQTTFLLPKNAPRPVIFKVGPNREEHLINSRTRGDTVVVDGTADYWVLRIGDDAVCVGRAGAIRRSVNHGRPSPPRGFFQTLLRGGRNAG